MRTKLTYTARAHTAAAKEPKSFSTIFAAYSLIDSHNVTAYSLSKNVPSQSAIIRALAELRQTGFINLVQVRDHARIAMALYAGNGIVTKITPQNYMPRRKFPFVLFPFQSRQVIIDDILPSFVIENFPYLDVATVSDSDVDAMRSMLDSCGLRFSDEDDRVRNIGRLPDKSLAILDGDAVEPIRGRSQERASEQLRLWQEKVRSLYPRLYAPGFEYVQSATTNYSLYPYMPAAEPEHAIENPFSATPSFVERIRAKFARSSLPVNSP